MPERIQMSRQRPWRAEHPDAVIVDRSTRFGNPIRITPERIDGRKMFRVHGSVNDRHGGPAYANLDTARHFAAKFFEWDLLNGLLPDYPTVPEIREALRGRDLACWCSIRRHRNGLYEWGYCHADALITVANYWEGDL